MESIIESTQNPYIKSLKKLDHGKARNQSGLFLVEGEKCIVEALGVDSLCSKMVVLQTERARYDDLLRDFAGEVLLVSDAVINAISSVKTPQSIVAVCKTEHLAQAQKGGIVIALDGISDPGNMGAIIRTADAIGASCIYTLNGSADFLNPKVIRASMGSVFHIPIIKADKSDISALKTQGYCILGADLKGTTDFIIEQEKMCMVIGSEAHGISEEISALIDMKIKIPIYGKAESLNAAVAASILMYKLVGY